MVVVVRYIPWNVAKVLLVRRMLVGTLGVFWNTLVEEAPDFFALVVGLRPQVPEAIQPFSIITQGGDKKCLFWDVLGVLLISGRGIWNTVDILECS